MKVPLSIFIASFLLLNAAIAQEGNTPAPEKITNRPNFILIMADDLGYGDISCYGNKYIKTPNIDKLAQEGIRFTDFHSNGPVCSPTRAALMTGKYQQRTGVNGVVTAARHRDVGMAIDEVTIADELKSYGYSTGIFGKWHLGYVSQFNPTLQGFDTFNGYVSGNVDYQAHIDQEGYFDWWDDLNIKDEKGYTTDLITKYGVDFINENNPVKTGKPFFLYLPHESPHYPYQRRNDKAVRKVGVPGTRSIPQDSIPGVYKEMIEILDEGVGRIMQTLKETGLDKNTIVIFCSDNGASKNGSNGILRGYKGNVYEGGHRVPAIAWHSSFRKNFTCDEPVLSMDFLPTFLDFINKKPKDPKIDGISIKKLLLKGENLPKRDLFWEFKNRSAIRSGTWKLIARNINGEKTVELYDLSGDISEAEDVTHLQPKVVNHLLQKLENWRRDVHHGVKVISD